MTIYRVATTLKSGFYECAGSMWKTKPRLIDGDKFGPAKIAELKADRFIFIEKATAAQIEDDQLEPPEPTEAEVVEMLAAELMKQSTRNFERIDPAGDITAVKAMIPIYDDLITPEAVAQAITRVMDQVAR